MKLNKKCIALASTLLLLGACVSHRNMHNQRDGEMPPPPPPTEQGYDNQRPPMGQEYENVKGLRKSTVGGREVYEANGVYYNKVGQGSNQRYRVSGYRNN